MSNPNLTVSIIAIVLSVLSLIYTALNDRRNRVLDAISVLDRFTCSDMAKARDIVGQAAHSETPVANSQKADLRQAMFRFLWETQCVAFLRKEIKGNSVITIHAQVIYRHLDLMIDSFNAAKKNNVGLADFSSSLKYANTAIDKLPKIKTRFFRTVRKPPSKRFE